MGKNKGINNCSLPQAAKRYQVKCQIPADTATFVSFCTIGFDMTNLYKYIQKPIMHWTFPNGTYFHFSVANLFTLNHLLLRKIK